MISGILCCCQECMYMKTAHVWWNAAIMLVFHAVIQPYENRRTNVLDIFMYTDMVLISLNI